MEIFKSGDNNGNNSDANSRAIYRRVSQSQEDDPSLNETVDDSNQNIEEFFENRNNCPFDGRLRRLKRKEIKAIEAFCIGNEIKKGRFAESDDVDKDLQCISVVYFSEERLPGLDVRVALKKITIGEVSDSSRDYINYSFKNEEIAARIRHFAVAPVFAKYEDPNGRELYLLSAFMDNGDLHESLKDNILDLKQCLRILFQIASAIRYLHTPVANYRKALLHLDIKSSNIALDLSLNARLIDFGLAREIEGDDGIKCTGDKFDVKYIGTPGYFPTDPVRCLTKHLDCFSFGVVIRETLTGTNPGEPCTEHNFWLRNNKTLCECLKKKLKSKWKGEADALSGEEIAKKCISSWSSQRNEVFTFEDVYKSLEELESVRGNYKDELPVERGNYKNELPVDKCDMCLINKASNEDMIKHGEYCRGKIQLCIQCVKSNYLNPVKCHSCDECKPEIGGHNTACISVAGDGKEVFIKDAEHVLETLYKKAHSTVCVRKLENSLIKPSTESSLKRIQLALDEVIKSSGIDTLILYYSGDGFKEKGLQLNGNLNEYISGKNLSKMLLEMLTKKQLMKIYIFFDCCYPPTVTNCFGNDFPSGVQIIQFSSSRPDHISSAEDGNEYSIFTSFLLGAILRKRKCILDEKSKEDDCQVCKKYWQKNEEKDFLKIVNIFGNIRKHMKKWRDWKKGQVWKQQPTRSAIPPMTDEENFSFSIKSTVSMQLKIVRENLNENLVHVDLNFFATLDSIRTDVFRKWLSSEWMDDYAGYADILSLKNGTLPSDLRNTNDLLHVWNSKQLLDVTLRSLKDLRTGRVGLFPVERKFGRDICCTGQKLREIVELSHEIKNKVKNEVMDIRQRINQAQHSKKYIAFIGQLVSVYKDELDKFENRLRVMSSFRIIKNKNSDILMMNGEDFCSNPFILGSDGEDSSLADIARYLRWTEIPRKIDIFLYIPRGNIDFVCLEMVRKDTMDKQDYVFYGDVSKTCRTFALHRDS
ncbi:uncharacterized protein LOC128205885 isoform X2 [Mya arenaria]|uniref:uncharacterized protein LOC128205885 isoform X2 n=1 Tax=Mya arenaria TaxID=6604 RepID=UPI0022E88053|nr:uncharacterized protein LOC128205885 isoform X2 [Mya arenaria]